MLRAKFKKIFKEKGIPEYEKKCYDAAKNFVTEKSCYQELEKIYYNYCQKILKYMAVNGEVSDPLHVLNPKFAKYKVKETSLEKKKLYQFYCKKCRKETPQTYQKLQIRRADEGTSTYSVCSICENKNNVD